MLAELVLEVLAREGREDPLDGREVLVGDGRSDLLAQRVGGGQLGVGLVGRDDAELLGGELGALGVGEQPGEEILGGLLVTFSGLGVDRQVVLGTDGDVGLVLTGHADVDRQEVDVLSLDRVAGDLGDLRPAPVAVLDHGGLAQGEVGHGVGDRLGAGLGGLDGGVVEVEVEDLLVVVRVCQLDLVEVVDLGVAVLVVDGVVGQVGLPAPVLTGGQRGRGEDALDTEVGLLGLHVLDDLLELVEALDLVDGGGLGTLHAEVLLEDGGVVDDAVALDGQRDAHDLALVALEGHGLIGQLLGEVGVGQVGGVVLPVAVAHGTVEVEQRGRVGLGDLGLQGLLVGAGSGGDDLDVHTGLLGVGGRDVLEGLLRLGLEVEEVDASGAVGTGRALRAGRQGRGDGDRSSSTEHGAAGDESHWGPPLDAWDRRGQRRPQGATAVSPAAEPSVQRRRPIMAHFRPHCCKVCNQWPGSQLGIFHAAPCFPWQTTDSTPYSDRRFLHRHLLQLCNDRSVRRRESSHHPLRKQDVAPAPHGCRGHVQRSVAVHPCAGWGLTCGRSRRSRGARRPRRRGRPCPPRRPCPRRAGRTASCCRPRRRS